MGLVITHKMPTQKQIKDNFIMGLSIEKDEVIKKDFKRVFTFLDLFREAKADARSKAMISFEFDDDPREAYQIQEVRSYVHEIFEKYPELFYYIHLGEHGVFQFLMLCFLQIKTVTDKTNGKKGIICKASPMFVSDVFNNVVSYARSIDDNNELAIKKITAHILNVLKS